MPTVWRMVTARFAASAFSGAGARLYGGRWNRKGVPMVYTAASQSLALLEMLVQDEPLRARYVMIPADIPNGVKVERMDAAQLPEDWRDFAARRKLQAIGTAWVQGLSSAVLAVPSAIVPDETNYLLNPLQAEFALIHIGEPQELVTDLRLFKART